MPNCTSNHVTPVGSITAIDNTNWSVPASTNFATGPFATDLYNSCNGITPVSLAAANLTTVPTTIIDPNGQVITAYLFADNYFELYINGVLVAVDAIPFTPFNSAVVKFKVSRPYTIAVKLVDWEEHLGIGSEIQSPTVQYHPGDGGFIAQFSDGVVTDASWKAQTFYIAPIQDLSSVIEMPNGLRSTATATTSPTCNANCYGIHYATPSNWAMPSFDDTAWPTASLYTASAVTNDISYTRYASTAWPNASFIWSSNLILDNLVLARKTVSNLDTTSYNLENELMFYPNPAQDNLYLKSNEITTAVAKVLITNCLGTTVLLVEQDNWDASIDLSKLPAGIYFLQAKNREGGTIGTQKIIKK
jgi:hypothetical protein